MEDLAPSQTVYLHRWAIGVGVSTRQWGCVGTPGGKIETELRGMGGLGICKRVALVRVAAGMERTVAVLCDTQIENLVDIKQRYTIVDSGFQLALRVEFR